MGFAQMTSSQLNTPGGTCRTCRHRRDQRTMSISFATALGPHAQALGIGLERTQLLAANIANADTPGFKARDIDFRQALAAVQGSEGEARLAATNARHFRTGDSGTNQASRSAASAALYRQPLQPALDGNTVELEREQAEFAQNALRVQTSLTLLKGKFSGLVKAIRGE